MPRSRRVQRLTTKRFTIYCEGETEGRYVDGLKTWLSKSRPDVRVAIERVDVHGGGYEEFAKRLRIEPDANCLARFVLLDYDRCLSNPQERIAFARLLELSRGSMRKRVPIVLIVSNENFEYALCCHDPEYREGDPRAFLVRNWGYVDPDDVKSDKDVWNKAHIGKRGHDIAFEHLCGRPCVIVNRIRWERAGFKLRLEDVVYSVDNESGRLSNLGELFSSLGICVK